MIQKLLFIGALIFTSLTTNAQIVINEIQYEGANTVELKNLGTTSVDVANYWLCNFPNYIEIKDLTITSGTTTIPAGGFLVLTGNLDFGNNGELGLYTSAAFSSSAAILDYIQWGSTGHQRSNVGVAANTWTENSFIPTVNSGQSIQFDGQGNSANDYTGGTPTFGTENFNNTLSSSIISSNIDVSVAPNPATNFININVQKAIFNATLYNVLGTKVATYNNITNKTTLDLSLFASGVYILNIVTNTNEFAKIKVIKK